jgi:uncharacterized LabA/DUF88 family protein
LDKKGETVYAFIDSQNLYLGIINSGWKLDYQKFRNYLRTKYKVIKAYLFIGYVPENTNLYRSLQEAGFILIFKPVLKINEGEHSTYKGNVDAELVLHAMIQYPNYHKAIIVSGDGDFMCLIEYLESKNKLYKILTPNNDYSSLLRKFAKFIVPLNLLKDKLRRNEEGRK